MISKDIERYIESNLPECSNNLELAYAIYVLLGQILYYSPLYATTKKLNTVPHPSKVTLDNPYVICYTWSEIYKELLSKYGIVSYIDNRNKSHSFVILESEGIQITADVTKSSFCSIYDISNDLTSIKFGLETNFFNLVPNQENMEEKKKKYLEIKASVNKKLNINPQDSEIEEYIKMLDSLELDSTERTVLLLNMLNSLYKLNDGEVERRQLFDRYYKQIFNDPELNNKSISILYKDITVAKKLVIVNEDRNIIYYLEDQEGFKPTRREEIDYLIKTGIIRFKYPTDLTFYKNIKENSKALLKK